MTRSVETTMQVDRPVLDKIENIADQNEVNRQDIIRSVLRERVVHYIENSDEIKDVRGQKICPVCYNTTFEERRDGVVCHGCNNVFMEDEVWIEVPEPQVDVNSLTWVEGEREPLSITLDVDVWSHLKLICRIKEMNMIDVVRDGFTESES